MLMQPDKVFRNKSLLKSRLESFCYITTFFRKVMLEEILKLIYKEMVVQYGLISMK